MQLCRGKELQHFPVFPFPSLLYLPTFHRLSTFPSLRSHFLPTLPSSYLPLLLPFPVPSVVSYIPLSLSTFPFSTQPSPSLLFLFPTYLFPYLSSSLPINFLLFFLVSFTSFFPFSFPCPFPFPPLGSLIFIHPWFSMLLSSNLCISQNQNQK